ncbi:PaaI family thioesterase [Hydrogenophaga sp. R2]|uniref:PaaI family thioesterase n=1 Tax=Hydrogenophaga sp. R2 TaxID=3132827 RepID=UPI003CF7F011
MAVFPSSRVGDRLEFSVRIPFVELLGFELRRMDGGEAEIAFDPAADHLNSFDVIHGGASMTLLDVVMAHAARSVQPDMGAVTIEMKTSFMRAAQGPVVAKGRLLHRTATMAFTEGQVFNAAGQLCCHATGTFKFVPRLPTGPASAKELNRVRTD